MFWKSHLPGSWGVDGSAVDGVNLVVDGPASMK